jgi:hypothetical protein
VPPARASVPDLVMSIGDDAPCSPFEVLVRD